MICLCGRCCSLPFSWLDSALYNPAANRCMHEGAGVVACNMEQLKEKIACFLHLTGNCTASYSTYLHVHLHFECNLLFGDIHGRLVFFRPM